MILDYTHPAYLERIKKDSSNQYNGAYYYAKEIRENIIPHISTDRNWVLLNCKGVCWDHSIVFIHNNLRPDRYDWLWKYDDLILVCGIKDTMKEVKGLGTSIYLPLSIDVDYVSKFRRPKTKDLAYVGRQVKRHGITFPPTTDYIEGLPRDELLTEMAKYRQVYAVGRTAIEARVLGCDILPFDKRYPDPSLWQVMDNLDAAKILQKELDSIERG